MKKKLAMTLLALSLMMTACGKDADMESNASQTATQTQTEATVSTPQETRTTQPVETETQSTEEATAEGYVPGTFTDTGYESEYLGYRFTLPEGYVLATDEELKELLGMSMEVMSEDLTELQKAYAQVTTVFDMMVSSPTGLPNLNVTAEKMNTEGVTPEMVAESLIAQLKSLTTMQCVPSEEYTTVEIAGNTYTRLEAVVTSGEVSLLQEYYVRLTDDRLINMTLTYSEDTAAEKDTLMSSFEAY